MSASPRNAIGRHGQSLCLEGGYFLVVFAVGVLIVSNSCSAGLVEVSEFLAKMPLETMGSPMEQTRSTVTGSEEYTRQSKPAASDQEKRESAHEYKKFDADDDNLKLFPVVVIPGIAGSGLFAKLNNATIPECSDKPVDADWHRIWITIQLLLSTEARKKCWASTMTLVPPNCTETSAATNNGTEKCQLYDTGAESLYRKQKGVDIDIEDSGLTTDFEYLDYVLGYGVFELKYLGDFVEAFRRFGYREGINLFGFPYDWRYPPWQMNLGVLKSLIERARRSTGRKVILVSHSLGSVITTYFLNTAVDAAWKADNIQLFLSVGGAFGGSPRIVQALLTGYEPLISNIFTSEFDYTIFPPGVILSTVRSFGSMYALLPSGEVYGENVPLVTIKKDGPSGQNNFSVYTSMNWTSLLPPQAAALAEQAKLYQPSTLQDPQVPVICLWSKFDDPTTDMTYHYRANASDLNESPEVDLTYGDDTLPLESLTWCTHWDSTILSHEFRNRDHFYIFRDKDFNNFVAALVSGLQPSRSFLKDGEDTRADPHLRGDDADQHILIQ